ncbi:hypothetical protein G6L97_26285 (plasmid) [Agrobacterium tumefaciens]|uniref:hypothetical protein n=1 Tax=Agrobacterium tumefaciens TaxID=358 RepID=UPI0015742B25|nr:hypothetical protein [Agrobacterium tumefaciens]NSZ87638.1 hypothetical protein [Agrobacterium tumefaciens]WCA72964.1 hypothetical protein G6L97_26285 [Agrobacterium tumefaciens]
MFKSAEKLLAPDPYYAGLAGFAGSTISDLHRDMLNCELFEMTPTNVRRSHDGVRHAYIYSYFSYDLLTLAAAQTFPCLELALRERIGKQFEGRTDRNGKPKPAMLNELLRNAREQGLIQSEIAYLRELRNMFMHGSDAVLNPPMFLVTFTTVTQIIRELYPTSNEGSRADNRG